MPFWPLKKDWKKGDCGPGAGWLNEAGRDIQTLGQMSGSGGISIQYLDGAVLVNGQNFGTFGLFELTEDVQYPADARSPGDSATPDVPWVENARILLLSADDGTSQGNAYIGNDDNKQTIYFPCLAFTSDDGSPQYIKAGIYLYDRIVAVFSKQAGRWEGIIKKPEFWFKLTEDLGDTTAHQASANIGVWSTSGDGSLSADTGHEHTVTDTLGTRTGGSGKWVLCRPIGSANGTVWEIVGWEQAEDDSILGKLSGTLSQGGSASMAVWAWNGSAFAATGDTVAVYDWLMKVGVAAIASGKKIASKKMGGIYVVWEAECP